MKNNSVNNRHTFFGSGKKYCSYKTLFGLMWTLLIVQAIVKFCQTTFSSNDSEELSNQCKPYVPFLLGLIATTGLFSFTREELEKNIHKLKNHFSKNKDSNLINYNVVNEYSEIDESAEAIDHETQSTLTEASVNTSWPKKIYFGSSIAIKCLSILAKPFQTYYSSLFEAKVLLTAPQLLNWPAGSLQVLIIVHVMAFFDTTYDLGTENAAIIKSLIKTINPHFEAEKERNCQCHSCCFTKVLSEIFALSGASSHSAKEAFAFCLLLVNSGSTVPVAAFVSATIFLAMLVQNYLFQGREFVKYVNRFVSYLTGAPTRLKENYLEIEDAVLPLNTKQKLLLTGLNILIGLLITVPSAISHAVLAKLTLNQGANDFWKFWFKEKPSAFYQNLIDKLSYIGITDAITDLFTESVETHLKITKQIKRRMTRTVAWHEEPNEMPESIPKLIL